MSSSERVRAYYDGKAARYGEQFGSGLLGVLRRREQTALLAMADPRPGERGLDAGAGPGFYARLLAARGLRMHAVDLSPRMVDEARLAGVDAEVADLEELALGSEFDLVVCAGALEFCPHPETVVQRLALHVAPGGRLVLLFPRRNVWGAAYRLYHRLHAVEARSFPILSVSRWLERAGLRVSGVARPLPLSAIIRAEATRP